MPLGETLTLLATLASALQTMRANRPAADPAAPPQPEVDAVALVTFDAVRNANEDALRLHEAASSRLNGMTQFSGAALLVSAFLGAVSTDAPEGDSPLFIASICLFVAVIAAVIVMRRVFGATRIEFLELTGGPLSQRIDALSQATDEGRRNERRNRSRAALLDIAGDVLLAVVSLQVVLAAVWLIS